MITQQFDFVSRRAVARDWNTYSRISKVLFTARASPVPGPPNTNGGHLETVRGDAVSANG